MKKVLNFFLFTAILFSIPLFTDAVSSDSLEKLFIESSYDLREEKISHARLVLTTEQIYFYVDEIWWEGLDQKKKEEYEKVLVDLGGVFKNHIYPRIKKDFGDAPEYEVDRGEKRITVLFHPMKKGSGGYFRTGDQYSIYQYSRSNERNILYLNADSLLSPNLPGYMAHEYMHLVTFNEKNKKFGVSEEIWLNELRAEAVISLLGYDKDYKGSNLWGREKTFLRDPDISLTEWTEQTADYGVANIFGQYLIDHYGKEILADSLQTELVGIHSIDYALAKNGFQKTFAEIFTDWKIAVYLNDCSYGEEFCYKNKNLLDLQVSPATVFIPSRDEGPVRVSYQTKNWAGNWYRVVGSSGTLHLNFKSDARFTIPYILCEKSGECAIDFFEIDKKGRGGVVVEDFNYLYESITIIPSLQQKFSGFDGAERGTYFQWEVEIREGEREKAERAGELQELRERMAVIRKGIEYLYLFLGIDLPRSDSLKMLEKDLYYGMTNSKEVKDLQTFLKKQGEDIYPERLVTGNFYHLTKRAVIRFQEKYREKILTPLGLLQGTGYVGKSTRGIINSFIVE